MGVVRIKPSKPNGDVSSKYQEPPVYWYCIACKVFCTLKEPCSHCSTEHTHRSEQLELDECESKES